LSLEPASNAGVAFPWLVYGHLLGKILAVERLLPSLRGKLIAPGGLVKHALTASLHDVAFLTYR